MSGNSKIVTIMKKIMKPFVLVAAAAMAFASCQKNEIPAPEKQDVHFTINAGIETKTSIIETLEENKTVYKAQWDGNEELGVLFAAPNAGTKDTDVVVLTNAESGSVASFQGTVTVDGPSGTFYAFYPAAAFNRGYEEGDARLDLKNAQKPTATSFDPSCDILVAKPYDYTVEEGAVVADGLEFARLMSVLRIDLNSEFADIQNEIVESVSFTAGDVEITGYARVFLDNPKFDKWASNGAQWCTVTANYDSDLVSINGTSNSVYLVIAPVTIPADKDLTFEIKTKNYNISKTIKSPEMKFTAGKVSKINLTIAADNCEKIDTSIDYSGEYLIAGKEGDKWYAAKKYTSGNYLAVSEIEFIVENIVETEAISDHYMTITKVVGGDYDGMYTIVDAGGKYLATSSSGDNYMKAESSASANTYWTIVKDEAKGTYSIVASKSDYTRNDMRFNYNSGTNSRVSCYDGTKTALPYLALFSTSLVKPDTTPSVSVAETTSPSIGAEGGDLTFTCTIKNLDGETLEVVEESDYLTWAVAENVVTITVTANEGADSRTLNATIKCGSVEVPVTINQAGKPAEGTPTTVTDKLVASLFAATSTTYADFSGVSVTSPAVYAGNSAKTSSGGIQLRSKSNSGIVTTTSGGKAKTITVTWASGNTSGRILDIYGKSTAYSAASDLYNSTARGTKLGSITEGTSTKLEITGDFEYIGLRSNDGAMYLTSIEITWETSGPGGETPVEPIKLATPVVKCSDSDITENSLKFTWDAIANASKYEVTFNNGTPTETTNTYYEATGLNANTNYSISVKAVGDDVNYTTSDAGTATGTTKEEQQSGGGDESVTVSNTIAKLADANSWNDATKYTSVNLDEILTASVSSDGSNTGKYYVNGENWRIYQNENPTLVISADDGYTIKTVKITYTINNYGVLTYNKSNITSGSVVDVNAASITFGVGNTGTATNGQVRVTAIEVVYQAN